MGTTALIAQMVISHRQAHICPITGKLVYAGTQQYLDSGEMLEVQLHPDVVKHLGLEVGPRDLHNVRYTIENGLGRLQFGPEVVCEVYRLFMQGCQFFAMSPSVPPNPAFDTVAAGRAHSTLAH